MDSKGSLPPYCPPACGGRWCVSTKGGGPAGCVERLCRKVRRKGAEGSLPPYCPPACGGKVVRKHQRGWARRARRLCRKVVFQGAGKRFKGFRGFRGEGLPPKAAMIIKSALRGLLLCHYGSPVISSGGNRRFESDFCEASEREPSNLPAECCLAAVSSA